MIRDYKKTLQKELSEICDDILILLDKDLIPACQTGESKVHTALSLRCDKEH